MYIRIRRQCRHTFYNSMFYLDLLSLQYGLRVRPLMHLCMKLKLLAHQVEEARAARYDGSLLQRRAYAP